MFAKIHGDEVVEYPIYDIRNRLPNVSIPLNYKNIELPDGFVYVHESVKPDAKSGHKVVEGTPIKINNLWKQIWVQQPYTQEELDQIKEYNAALARAERNRLLAESDWTQVPDSKVDKQAWMEYRQALRDISAQEEFPNNIVWPEKP